MLVNDNIAEYVSQEKRNYHETIHDGAIGMTCRLVGFKTSQESREWLISLRQSHRVLISSPLSPSQKECETNPSREKKNAAVFASRMSWKKITITSLTEVTRDEHNKSTSRKKKIFTPNAFKKFYMQARNILTNLSQARLDPKIPAWLTTLHHVKSYILRVLLYLHNDTKIYLRLNQNAQRWIGKKVPSFYFNNNRMSNKTRCDVTYL